MNTIEVLNKATKLFGTAEVSVRRFEWTPDEHFELAIFLPETGHSIIKVLSDELMDNDVVMNKETDKMIAQLRRTMNG